MAVDFSSILQRCLLLLCLTTVFNKGSYLSQKLHHFETLHVQDMIRSDINHVSKNHHCSLQFTALGRKFILLLRPHSNLFHSSVKVHVHNGSGQVEYFSVPRHEFFEGVVSGEKKSTVHAHINDGGILTASIIVQDEHYHVEPSRIHVHESHDYHMIMYKMSDHKSLDSIQHFCQENRVVSVHQGSRRVLRQSPPSQLMDGFSCSLHLIADYKFHQHIGRFDQSTTLAYMVNVLLDVDSVYRRTRWESSNGRLFNRIGLQITNVTIYTQPTASPSFNREVDSATPIDSNLLLEDLSHHDWTSYCLVHLFTFQLFSGKTLGVAYTAVPNMNALGGICSKAATLGGIYASTNVGLSSFKDRESGGPVLQVEGDIIVAHEIGHNFGSKHDPASGGSCDPPLGRSQGKFIMYPAAVDGTERNNQVFSPCSRLAIGNTLEKRGLLCFTATSTEVCGNWFVENREECDGGPGGDACCTNDCKLRPQAKCSDANDLCCRVCDFANASVKCAERSTALVCKAPSFCTGSSSTCPPQEPLVGVSCPQMGVCMMSNSSDGANVSVCHPFCTTVGMEPCQCTSEEDQCKVCCVPLNGGTCAAYGDMPLSNGALCNGGYCRGGSCVQGYTDLSGRLRRLFTNLSADEILLFVRENLVGCIIILCAVGWIAGLAFVKCVLVPLWHKKLHKIHGIEFTACCGVKTSRVKLSQSMDPRTPTAMTPLKRSWSTRSGTTKDHFYGRNMSYRRALRSPLVKPSRYSTIDEEKEAGFLY